MGILKEFKEFASRGNVVDLAVGFILGGAFSTIVKSLVNDVIMPPIGLILGGVDFSAMKYVMKDAVTGADGAVVEPEVAINYGLFINNVISFLILALILFFLIRTMNKLKARWEDPASPEEPPAKPRQEVLLEEIRDALVQKKAD
ncbi:large-conductance mechanosensitive channel protein MscL [Ponticaulis profundi]|uniref:Large-conductance mechanosensitive channel n=1 Tax=Ponticaulis profundi TaxID=2665222 RepID=A0ABW1S7E0_9PROT